MNHLVHTIDNLNRANRFATKAVQLGQSPEIVQSLNIQSDKAYSDYVLANRAHKFAAESGKTIYSECVEMHFCYPKMIS